jgi:hypothetical protein
MRAHRFFAGLCVLLLSALAQDGTASLTGKVQDITGAVIPGVIAKLQSEEERGRVVSAKTDESGTYRFDNVPSGRYELNLARSGFDRLTVKEIPISTAENGLLPAFEMNVSLPCKATALDYLRLLSPREHTGSIRGSVDSANGPVANANIILLCKTGVCGKTRTDLHGSFEFMSLSSREFAVRVRHSGFYSAEVREFYARAGVESVYLPIHIERCRLGLCASWLRPKKPIAVCE